MSNERTGGAMYVVAVIIFIALMTMLFGRQLERHRNPNLSAQAVEVDAGVSEIRLQRNRFGHYVVTATINGLTTESMVDTGASSVAVSAAIAETVGLKAGPRIEIATANGMTEAYATRIAELRVGGFIARDILAVIVPNLDGQVLLGMSFLELLDFSQEGKELILRSRHVSTP